MALGIEDRYMILVAIGGNIGEKREGDKECRWTELLSKNPLRLLSFIHGLSLVLSKTLYRAH